MRSDRVQAGEEREKLAVITSLVGKNQFEIWSEGSGVVGAAAPIGVWD